MRSHGGELPAYLEYFENGSEYCVLYDQIQSEQSSRFYKKRNRNMILMVEEEIEVLPNFMWMTLGQIKQLMKIDNLVNMDTRTVLSGIPLVTIKYSTDELTAVKNMIGNEAFFNSVFMSNISDSLIPLYQHINDYKMFHEVEAVTVPLFQLVHWSVDDYGITSDFFSDFCVRYYDIEINGREVKKWIQPLFKAIGSAIFGLICKKESGVLKLLVSMKAEIGSFDKVEISPSIQWGAADGNRTRNNVELLFENKLKAMEGIILDVKLSEEGGRFYHEQNRNIILEISCNELLTVPKGYFWVDLGTLNYLVQINNCLNIQLRNLLALLDI